jgi:hypothetical protein
MRVVLLRLSPQTDLGSHSPQAFAGCVALSDRLAQGNLSSVSPHVKQKQQHQHCRAILGIKTPLSWM